MKISPQIKIIYACTNIGGALFNFIILDSKMDTNQNQIESVFNNHNNGVGNVIGYLTTDPHFKNYNKIQ